MNKAEMDFDEREASYDAWLKTRKICFVCGEPITGSKYWSIPCEGAMCEDCLNDSERDQD